MTEDHQETDGRMPSGSEGEAVEDSPGVDISTPGSRWLTPIESRRIRSRVEELAPGESVGEHVTHHREEVVLFLLGRARVTLEGKEHVIDAPRAVYIGPEVTHDIANAGDGVLRYVYVVALHHDPSQDSGDTHSHL